MGYIAFPTFGRGQGLSQGADASLMESPDLLAYLIAEADALARIAERLDKPDAAADMEATRDSLLVALESLWNGSRYSYRDRDSHYTGAGIRLLRDGAGDAAHRIERALETPQRVIVRVVGGMSHVPQLNMRLSGRDASGAPITIEADIAAFDWHHRQGIYITPQTLSFVDAIAISGLSRVYKVYAATVDCARLDVNHLLPLWTGRLPQERAAALVDLALDESHFLCRNGLTMVSRADSNYDPSNARGGGGIWLHWLSLVGEGMIKCGFRAEATRLLQRTLDGLCAVMQREKRLSQFYHADETKGYGEAHHLAGIAPLQLLREVIGIEIIAPDKARVRGEFTWGQPVTVEQHGVVVRRDSDSITIEFPSGETVVLPADAPPQIVHDPAPPKDSRPMDDLPSPPELPDASADETRLTIDIDDSVDADPEP